MLDEYAAANAARMGSELFHDCVEQWLANAVMEGVPIERLGQVAEPNGALILTVSGFPVVRFRLEVRGDSFAVVSEPAARGSETEL